MILLFAISFALAAMVVLDVIRQDCYRWFDVWPRKPGTYKVAWWAVREYGWISFDVLRRRDGTGSLISLKFSWEPRR